MCFSSSPKFVLCWMASRWPAPSIILDIKCLVSSLDHVRFTFVPVYKNQGAHMLAKLSYCLNQDFILNGGRDLRGYSRLLPLVVLGGCLVCCFVYIVC